jgi:4-diphosphocytidyl-2-C-methyl-D-erythritol kinase
VTTLRTRAYAKINMGLEVLGKRPDGYHDIVTLVHTISLHDVVECKEADRLSVVTEPPVVGEAENLAGRAARLLASHAGRKPSAHLIIRKAVPLAAGLGGGSSDAAATLRLLKRLWGLGQAGMMTVAASVGSDVPLFVRGGAALVSGRGERVASIALGRTFWIALACPRFDVGEKTRALYSALTPADWSDGAATTGAAGDFNRAFKRPFEGARFPNAFDRAASMVYPGYAELRRRLEARAATPLSLTGAGPSLYALFESRSAAAAAAARMAELGVPTYVARSVTSRPKIETIAE